MRFGTRWLYGGTRNKAHDKREISGPALRRDLDPF